jgi:hypothetical protein
VSTCIRDPTGQSVSSFSWYQPLGVPSSWDARPTYKGRVAYATNRGGAFTQAGRVPLGLRPALRHLFETTSVIRCVWKNTCFNILGSGPQHVETFVFHQTLDDRGCFKTVLL